MAAIAAIAVVLSLLLTPALAAVPAPVNSPAAANASIQPAPAFARTCTAYVALGQTAVFDYQIDTARAIEVNNMMVQYGGWDIAYWTIGVKGAVNRAYVLTLTRQLTRWTQVGTLSIRRTSNWYVGSVTVLYPCAGGVHYYN